LDCIIEVLGADVRISQGNVFGQNLPPTRNLLKEGSIYLSRSSLTLLVCCELVKGALKDCILGEYAGDLIPFGQEVLIGQVKYSPFGGLIGLIRFYTAIIDGEFFKVGEDG